MPIGIGFCIDGFPFWCDDRDDGPGDGRDKPADPHPPTPVPVVPPPVNIWQGPNVFGCSLTYVGGDRVHKRTSFNRQQIGIKMEFSCPQNPGQMYLRVVISRRRGWVWTEEMGDPREQTLLASQGNTIRMMDYATRCVEGSEEEYWAVFFAEADDLQNRVASWYEGSSPPVRIRC